MEPEKDYLEEESERNALPDVLAKYRGRIYVGAGLIFLFTIVLVAVSKTLPPLLLLLVSAYLCWTGFSLERKWNQGKIAEIECICTRLRPGSVKDRVLVSFTTTDDSGKIYQFSVPGKSSADNFVLDSAYLIYFIEDEPNKLLGYTPI